jgi:hypothetical protein
MEDLSRISEYLTVHFIAVYEYARLVTVIDYLKNSKAFKIV